MNWSYDVKTQTTGDDVGIVPRVNLEEAAALLRDAGLGQTVVVRVLRALTGLRSEVDFNVSLVFSESEKELEC